MQLKKMDPKNLKMERFKMVKEASQFWIARDEDLDLLGFFSSVVLNGIFLISLFLYISYSYLRKCICIIFQNIL